MKNAANALSDLKERLCRREHLGAKECDDAMLPTLEHASLVHSNIHGRNVDLTNEGLKEASGLGHEDTYQTLSVIVYISLVIVAYVIIVMWLVSTNFRSAAVASKATATRGTGFLSSVVDGFLAGVYRTRAGCASRGRKPLHVAGAGAVATERLLDSAFEVDTEGLIETEALLVMQDEAGKAQPTCSTNFEEDFEGEPV